MAKVRTADTKALVTQALHDACEHTCVKYLVLFIKARRASMGKRKRKICYNFDVAE